jgi:ubiquitin carboxyl-terminal hydrolase 10
VVPIVAQSPPTPRQQSKDRSGSTSLAQQTFATAKENGTETSYDASAEPVNAAEEPTKSASQPSAPKSWADLVRSKTAPRGAGVPVHSSAEAGGLAVSRSQNLAEVLKSLGTDVDQYSDKTAFLEPRGLVNTGNMCYMNSVSHPLFWFTGSPLTFSLGPPDSCFLHSVLSVPGACWPSGCS